MLLPEQRVCGIAAQTAICHIRLSWQPPQVAHPFHGLIETVPPCHRNDTVSRNHSSLLRDKHLQERTSSKHSQFLIFPENYNLINWMFLGCKKLNRCKNGKIKYLQKLQKEKFKYAKNFSKVHFWTVFMVGGRRCSENICVHNCLKYHVSYLDASLTLAWGMSLARRTCLECSRFLIDVHLSKAQYIFQFNLWFHTWEK